MNRIGVGALVIAIGALFAGCSSTPATPEPAVATPPAASATPHEAGTPGAVAASNVAAQALPAYLDPASPISRERSVYFDYDDFSIKSQYIPMLERHARYLVSNPTLKVRIEGNTDERGGTEYNLALGQKRAEAVQKALTIYGVNPSQMESVSWGKERPQASGHDEAAWAQNRRVDIVYPKQ